VNVLWASRSRQLPRAQSVTSLIVFGFDAPILRPMVNNNRTDSLADYGQDAEGARSHDFIRAHALTLCNKLLNRERIIDFHFHSKPSGGGGNAFWVTEFDVHECFKCFSMHGLDGLRIRFS